MIAGPVTNLFLHSLPGMILLHLATPFLHQRCFCMRNTNKLWRLSYVLVFSCDKKWRLEMKKTTGEDYYCLLCCVSLKAIIYLLSF